MQLVSNTEDRIIWYGITLTYAFYLTGTLYVVHSLLGWALLLLMILRWYVEGRAPKNAMIPITAMVWVICMLAMLVALLVAHGDFKLGMGQTIKSSIGWVKGWALFALFVVLGAALNFKAQLVTRACCILAAQSVVFVFVSFAGVIVGMDGPLYLSPLKAVGGPISMFEVNLFGMNPETGKPRWPFFAPWSPAAGMISCIYLVICSQETDKFWRNAGMLGAFLMCIFCQSRAGWAVFLLLIPFLIVFGRVKTPFVLLMLGITASMLVLWGGPVFEQILDIHQQIKDARPDSTRVRADLATIALQRWESEAYLWGHGIVEVGPKIVEHMPIGSHHSWYGVLFIKGLVGFIALAIALAMTVLNLILIATQDKRAWGSLLIMVVIVGYSFFENLEILAYLLWPAFLWIGMTLNPMKVKGVSDE